MIARTADSWQGPAWQEQLSDVIRDPAELCRLLGLNLDEFECRHLAGMDRARAAFPLRVPRAFVSRMEKGRLDDPLLLQVLPQAQEMMDQQDFTADPLDEASAERAPGIIQKYRGRVLLMVSSACAINCRYCFRRHFPYEEHRLSRSDWEDSLQLLAGDPSVREVIYSGGDPLSAPDRLLAWLTEQIRAIPHIRTLRIHTRLPVVIPERIDPDCLAWLQAEGLRVVVVLHINHAREIDERVGRAAARLQRSGAQLLNQAVLLRGVNDRVGDLAELSERLFDHRILPYYLHMLDRVQGAAHFRVSEEEALALHGALRDQLPGYLVPRLAREVAGEGAKQVLA